MRSVQILPHWVVLEYPNFSSTRAEAERGGGGFSKLSAPLGVGGDHRSTEKRVEECPNFLPYWG